MFKQSMQFVRKERFVFIALGCFLIAFFILSVFSYPIPHAFEEFYFGRMAGRVSQGIATDEGYVYQQVGEVASSSDLAHAIQADDFLATLSLLQQEQKARGLDAFTATDANGVVITRTQVVSDRGDYIFQTTPYGQALAAGKSIVSIEKGTNLPLLIIAGFPVDASGTMVGAVFGGYSVDNAYAHSFRGRYLNGSNNLIFYSKTAGMVGTTFESPTTTALLAAYFNTGSDWIEKGLSDREVMIEDRSYFVKNIPFKGIDGSVGGVLVLYPDYRIPAAVGFALPAALLFLLILYYFHVRSADRRRIVIENVLLGTLTAAVFVIAFFDSYLVLAYRSMVIAKPPYLIYNSTLGLAPDSGLLDRSVEHQIAVTVETGGEAVNAAQVNLTYDPTKLQVTGIETANSFCEPDMFIQKDIDNHAGEVQVACVTTPPGLSGNGTVFDLDVQGLANGPATLHFASGTAVLAEDGLGTNVLRLSTDGSYTFADERQPVVVNGIASVLAFSPTHPDSARWYNDPNLLMTWTGPAGEEYHYAIDQSPTAASLAGASTTASESVALDGLADGVWYFHIAADMNGVLGPISDYKVMIDTGPPTPPDIEASQTTIPAGQVVRLAFTSEDALSGLANNYYVKFDDGIFLPTASPLYIALPEGEHTVTVRAFDNAGNYADNSVTIDVTQ
jgi:hypothetical protein